jgi:hypothetical protein
VPSNVRDVADYFLVRSECGPQWDHAKPRRQQAQWDEHAAFMDALAEEGIVVLGGPLGEAEDDDVLIVAAVPSEAEIRAQLAGDPWFDTILSITRIERWSIWLRSPNTP